MSDDAYAVLVAAQLEIDACQREFRRLRALMDSDDADVRSIAHRQWTETLERHAAARATIDEARHANA